MHADDVRDRVRRGRGHLPLSVSDPTGAKIDHAIFASGQDQVETVVVGFGSPAKKRYPSMSAPQTTPMTA